MGKDPEWSGSLKPRRDLKEEKRSGNLLWTGKKGSSVVAWEWRSGEGGMTGVGVEGWRRRA